MRTTLDIADDVLQAARERARRVGKTVGAVSSEQARAALGSSTGSSEIDVWPRSAQTRMFNVA